MTNDPKDLIKQYYSPSVKQPQIITIPPMNFIMIDGHGDPNTDPSYATSVSALYTLAYTLKFDLKKFGTPEFKVFPLQGLWWAENIDTFITGEKSAWDWTMMIGQPDWITPEHVEQARIKTTAKVGKPTLDKVRFETYNEGLVVQLMHIGPYSAEGPNIARMHTFAREQGYALAGKHHEIYLGNPQRTAPEKLKTIIRQPISKAAG
jgi:hypothetical protein